MRLRQLVQLKSGANIKDAAVRFLQRIDRLDGGFVVVD